MGVTPTLEKPLHLGCGYDIAIYSLYVDLAREEVYHRWVM